MIMACKWQVSSVAQSHRDNGEPLNERIAWISERLDNYRLPACRRMRVTKISCFSLSEDGVSSGSDDPPGSPVMNVRGLADIPQCCHRICFATSFAHQIAK